MKHIKLFEQFINESLTVGTAIRAYSRFNRRLGEYTRMDQYWFNGNEADNIIKQFKLDPNDANYLTASDMNKFIKLAQNNHFDEYYDLSGGYSVPEYDLELQSKYGDNYDVIEIYKE